MLNAEGLAKIMNDLFDGVLYAGKFKVYRFIFVTLYFSVSNNEPWSYFKFSKKFKT